MIDIFYIENKELLLTTDIDFIESLIGDAEKDKGRRYRKWQDKQAYLLGKFLIAVLLKKYGYSGTLLKNLTYTEFNRPFINEVKADFNISHSGEFVICAFSDKQIIGVDIEQIQSVDIKDFYYILNGADKERIRNSSNQYFSFFKIWSAKEAILKAHGCGLTDNLHELKINDDTGIFDKTKYYLKEVNIHPDYSSCIASSAPIEAINIEKTSINNWV